MTESAMRPYSGDQRRWVASRTGQLLGMVVVIGIAFGLRAYHLGHFSLWLDETITYSVASHPYGAILDAREVERDHVVTQYVIAHLGIVLHMDAHEWLLRLPSMLFGVATVAAVWLLGNALFGRTTAAVAALFTALWPSLILSSQ
ncbi:MAG: glycosyltransferase family 39 protein, partial [Gemmatimonadaceae bacterium]